MDAGWFYVAAATGVVISMVCVFFLTRQYKTTQAKRKKARSQAMAHDKFLHYQSSSDQPRHAFNGSEAVIVFKREDFIVRNGREEPTFIYLSRNVFDEYFFCVIDLGLSMVHLPKERALSFLKDFPKEYAAELDYLSTSTARFKGQLQPAS